MILVRRGLVALVALVALGLVGCHERVPGAGTLSGECAAPACEEALAVASAEYAATRRARASGSREDADVDKYAEQRAEMVATIARYGLDDARVLGAMGRVERHRFVPDGGVDLAYADRPLPIGRGQTISQPYIVARLTELVRPTAASKVLDVGTGSGYQAAVLAETAGHVFSIEIVCELADAARDRLEELGYTDRVTVRCGDGYRGWPSEAPFDAIVVAAAPERIPPALLEQLAPNGRLVIPVGPQGSAQHLEVVHKHADGTLSRSQQGLVRFVPMTGEVEEVQ